MQPIPDPRLQLPVTLVTGFLGAGKTTVLAHLLRQPALRRTAVIINEFGEMPLDHELVEKAEEDIVEVSGGCLCCTVRGDLSRAIRTLDLRRRRGRIDFERILIETTGLADPAPILHTLITDPMIAHGYRLDGVVTVVDAVNGPTMLDSQQEAARQVAVADRVLVSKTDRTGGQVPLELRRRLGELAPLARPITVSHGVVAPEVLLDLGPWRARTRSADVERWLGDLDALDRTDAHHHHDGHDPNRHDERIRAFCLRRGEPITAAGLGLFLDTLTSRAGPDLLRVKGIVKLAEEPDRPMVVHAVQHIVHEPVELDAWPSGDRDTRIVMIVRDIQPQAVGLMFDVLQKKILPKTI